MQETDPAGQHAVTAGAGGRAGASPGAAASVCAALSAGLVLALSLTDLVLLGLTRDLAASFSGALPVGGLLFAGLGLVITRRQPGNPIVSRALEPAHMSVWVSRRG